MDEESRNSVHVRVAERADVPVIVRLLVDDALGAGREQLDGLVAPDYWVAFDAIAGQPGNELLVAELDGVVVGCLQLTLIAGFSRRGATRAQVEGVRVAAQQRSRGIGATLMRVAMERARAQGATLMQLTSDASRERARRFYEGLGFVASHVGMKRSLIDP
ncbi:MAG: GNAT family N-acetyltransferase [Gemmatimonadota bacterium]